jgi:hypothetical protein
MEGAVGRTLTIHGNMCRCFTLMATTPLAPAWFFFAALRLV